VIFVFGIAATIAGIGSLWMTEFAVEVSESMRAGSNAVRDPDLAALRVILYVNAILTTIVGLGLLVGGSGIFLLKNWGRIAFLSTLILMMIWLTYSLGMITYNRGFDPLEMLTFFVVLSVLGALYYFFAMGKIKSSFKLT
jgi:hypothetical protein